MKISSLFVSLVLPLFFSAQSFAEAPKTLSGRVSISKDLEKELSANGALFIFAKKASDVDAKGVPPLAVLRIPSPQFPMAFSLSQENAMMAGTSFEGPFVVYARYSPSGDALDKSGPQGTTNAKKPLKLGAKNISLELIKK